VYIGDYSNAHVAVLDALVVTQKMAARRLVAGVPYLPSYRALTTIGI
jgi:hypothetical protein